MQKTQSPAATAVAAGQGTSRRPDCRHLLRGGGCPDGAAAVSLGRAYPGSASHRAAGLELLSSVVQWWPLVAIWPKTLLYNLALSLSHKATSRSCGTSGRWFCPKCPAYPWETFWTPPAAG